MLPVLTLVAASAMFGGVGGAAIRHIGNFDLRGLFIMMLNLM